MAQHMQNTECDIPHLYNKGNSYMSILIASESIEQNSTSFPDLKGTLSKLGMEKSAFCSIDFTSQFFVFCFIDSALHVYYFLP